MELIRNSKIIDKKFREFFIPTILTAMSSSFMLMADSIFVGNMLGASEFAAVNCCVPIQQIFGMVSELLGLGGSTAISVARGRRESQKANQIFTAVLFLLAAFSLILLLPQVYATSFFGNVLAKDPILYPIVLEYYGVLIWSVPFVIFVPTMEYILRAEGRPQLASIITVVSNVVNIGLDAVFMGPMHMGIRGAALASIIGYGVGFIMSVCALVFGKRTLHLCFGRLWSSCREIIYTGLPAAMGVGLVAVKIYCLNYIVMATAGNTGMVAFSICLETLSLCSMFMTASAQTMMPILGIYYGERDCGGARMVLQRTFRVMLICAGGLTLFLEAVPEAMLFLYGVKEAETAALAVQALRIYALSLCGLSISFLMMCYYMTIEKQKLANIISVINGLVIIVPCAYILSKCMGITGIWLSFPITELLTILYIFLVAKGKLSHVYQIKEEEPAIFEISVLSKEDMGAHTSEQMIAFLDEHRVERKLSNKIGIAIEEMVENIYRYSDGKKVNIDVRLLVNASNVVLSFCDDGAEFDPTTYQPEETGNYLIDHITMLKAISQKIEYQRVIGLNKTMVFF